MSVTPDEMRTRLEEWLRGLWLRPPDLRAEIVAARARPTCIPMWLVDARVQGEWRAEIGFDYQAVSSVERYGQGQGWRSQRIIEPRVRWEPRLGRLDRRHENVPVPALQDHGVLPGSLRRYDLRTSRPYTAEAIAGASIRIPTLEPSAPADPGSVPSGSAWPEAERAIREATETDCLRAAGGQHARAFRWRMHASDVEWTLLLLPAYVSWYTEGGRAWPVFVNGQTGQVSGARLASRAAARTLGYIIGALGLVLLVAGVLLALVGVAVPPVAALGAVLAVVGLVTGVLALVPPLMVWEHNRRAVAALPPPLGRD